MNRLFLILALGLVTVSTAQAHPGIGFARKYADAMCLAIPGGVQQPGDTFVNFHCQPDHWNNRAHSWEYRIWTDEYKRGQVTHWYVIAFEDGMVDAEVKCAQPYPSTCGLVG